LALLWVLLVRIAVLDIIHEIDPTGSEAVATKRQQGLEYQGRIEQILREKEGSKEKRVFDPLFWTARDDEERERRALSRGLGESCHICLRTLGIW
jgi:hypothetical protein